MPGPGPDRHTRATQEVRLQHNLPITGLSAVVATRRRWSRRMLVAVAASVLGLLPCVQGLAQTSPAVVQAAPPDQPHPAAPAGSREGELDNDKEGEAAPASPRGCDSPIRSILARSSFLALTQEQQQELELLGLDHCAEVARLSSERLLLELEARRSMLTSRLGGRRGAALTVESLAAIDAVTIKLRQAWLHAYEKATALLSPDQSERYATRLGNPPNFVDLNESSGAGLDTRIADAISARLKDTKVVEIETAQAIVERTIGWVKSAALVTGVPLALLVVVLAILGLNSWRNFITLISQARTEAEAKINQARTEAEAKINDARESVYELSTEATKVRSSYEQLQQKIGYIPTLASNLGGFWQVGWGPSRRK